MRHYSDMNALPRPLERTLRYVVFGGIFLLPLSVLVVAPGLSFPFITGKNFAFRIIVEIVFAAWLMLALYLPAWRPRFSLISGAVALFVLAIGVADVFGVNIYRSFWSNFERMDGFISLLHSAAMFVVLVSALSAERLWERFFAVSFGASILIALYGLLQYFGFAPMFQSATRVESLFGNSGFLAAYALVTVFLAAFFAIRSGSARFLIPKTKIEVPRRWLYGAVLLLNLVVLALSATRGAIFGAVLAALLGAALVIIFEKTNTFARRLALGIIVFFLASGAALWFFSDTPLVRNSTVLSRVSSISISKKEQPRLIIWDVALKGIVEKPILGWGQENFTRVFDKHYDPMLHGEEPWFDRAHNAVLDTLVAGGVVGLLAYLALFATALATLWRGKRAHMRAHGEGKEEELFSVVEKSILTALFAGYFFQGLFIFDTIGTYLLFFALLAYLASHTSSPRAPQARAAGPAQPRYVYGTFAVIALLLVGALYTVNINPLRASYSLVRATTPQDAPQKNIDFLNEAFSRATFGEEEIVLGALSVAQSAARSASLSQQEKARFLDMALTHADKEVYRFRDSARLYVRLGDTLVAHGYPEEALIAYEKARELSPKKQRILFQIGIADLALGKRDEAKQIFAEAYALAPDFVEARKLYALASIYTDDATLADALLSELPSEKWVFDNRFLDAYTGTRRYADVVTIWKARVAAAPEDFMMHVGLAAAYALNGKPNAGIAEIREAILRTPERAEEGERYIESIRTGRVRE